MLRGNWSSSTISARQSGASFFQCARFPAAPSACSARKRRRTSSSNAGLFSNQRLSRSPLPNQKARIDAARESLATISCDNACVTNRLAKETSPYLQQHAANPVDWYPWGPEALERARREDKPILLSIGYSACHWCHVMAHESFEDPAVAAVMNRLFVNIKVDREERPDLDQIYQTAHQMLAQRAGGWPLTMFLTPEGAPFFGGTYFPKQARHGMPAFPQLCERIAAISREQRGEIAAQNEQGHQAFASTLPRAAAAPNELSAEVVQAMLENLRGNFDATFGGFGGAPKFPHPTDLELCLREGEKDIALV